MDPSEALEVLRHGNERFLGGDALPSLSIGERAALDEGQSPLAGILGCSDSRVPVEIVFNLGPGRLFVTRNAGNIVGPHVLGSFEYAVEFLECRLLVVLGHSDCGAASAAESDLSEYSPALARVVGQIREVVQHVESGIPAVEANIRHGVVTLREHFSAVDGLVVEGALYELVSGRVRFLKENS